MQLNNDFARAVVLNTADIPWQPAPFSGVLYRMLEQDGAQGTRATSVVRYQAGTHLPAHSHDLGEEIIVLHGEFADESGVYAAGSYIKNPPGSTRAMQRDWLHPVYQAVPPAAG